MSSIGLYRFLWILVGAAMAVAGGPGLFRERHHLPLLDRGPDGSVNSILTNALGVRGLARPLDAWLRELPPGEPVLLVVRPESQSALLLAYAVSYLAWPRPVEILDQPVTSGTKPSRPVEAYCAVGWCLQPPPPARHTKSVAPGLVFVSIRPLPE